MKKYLTPVGVMWNAHPIVERRAAMVLALAWEGVASIVPRAPVDLLFSTVYPAWWQQRMDVWMASYEVDAYEIEIDGAPVAFLTCRATWLWDCAPDILAGKLRAERPTAKQATGFSGARPSGY